MFFTRIYNVANKLYPGRKFSPRTGSGVNIERGLYYRSVWKKKNCASLCQPKKTALLQQPALPRDQSLRVAHVSGRTHLKIDSDSFGRGPYFSQIPTWQDTRSLNSAARSPHIIYRMRFLHEDIGVKRLRTRDRSITQLQSK